MLATKSSFTSHLVYAPAFRSDITDTASRIMQFDPKGNCQTPEIAFAIIKVLELQNSRLVATEVNIFRNALVCGYERELLDRIEDRIGAFEPDPALRSALQDEGILLEKKQGRLWLTRSQVEQETDSATQLALSELGLPKEIVKLIVSKAHITPKEKTGAIEQYLGQDISGWTHQQLNDALLAKFDTFSHRPLPGDALQLEISDFEFSVPLTATRCLYTTWVKLIECRLTSGKLKFLDGTVISTHKDGIPIASSSRASAFASVPGSLACAELGGTAFATAENSTAQAEGRKSKSFAMVPLSSAVARNFARAHAWAASSSATAYSSGWAIAEAHSSACAINNEDLRFPAITMTALQFDTFKGKPTRQRSTVKLLIGSGLCTPSVALGLPDAVLRSLQISMRQIYSMDIAVANRFCTLLQNEKFIEELGSLACQQQLKAGTITLHDLIERYSMQSSRL